MAKTTNRYQQLIEKIFSDRFSSIEEEIPFERTDLEIAAKELAGC